MLLYQQQKNKERLEKQNGTEGVYVPKEMRVEQKRAFISAHFTLGDKKQRKSITSLLKVIRLHL